MYKKLWTEMLHVFTDALDVSDIKENEIFWWNLGQIGF